MPNRPAARYYLGGLVAKGLAVSHQTSGLPHLELVSHPPLQIERPQLWGMTHADLQELMQHRGLAKRQGTQLFSYLFARRVDRFASMDGVSKRLRQLFESEFDLRRPRLDVREVSRDGTRKYRFCGADNAAFEAVYLPCIGGQKTNTLCISSQTGCAVGCRFCFTASIRRNRNLTAAEIIGQVMNVHYDVLPLGEAARVTNIVFMGMGEPLLNYDNVVKAARILLDPAGLGFSKRRVTVSTAGIVPRIAQLGHAVPVQLAVSLNATTDAVRSEIMPINKKWPIARLIAALKAYPLAPGRRITIEYVLLGGVNDSLADAQRLVDLLADIPAKVNLLPLNPHDRTPYAPPTTYSVRDFQRTLRAGGLHALVRTARGQDISAACGQLGETITNANLTTAS